MKNHRPEIPENELAPYQPTVRDMLLLQVPITIQVSPQGGRIAVNVRTTDWKENRYQNICYVCDLAAGTTYPLNRTGSVQQIEWVDENTLALLKKNTAKDAESQIWLYEGLVGEGWLVTEHETGVEWFKPFAGGLLFRARHPERDQRKQRASRFGKFTHFEQEKSSSALYYLGLDEMRRYRSQTKSLTHDEAKGLVLPIIELSQLLREPLSIQDVIPSPTGKELYLNCWPHDDLIYYRQTSAYHIELDASSALDQHMRRQQSKQSGGSDCIESTADSKDGDEQQDLTYLGTITRLQLPAGAEVTAVSPDGGKLLIAHRERDELLFTRQDLWLIHRESALAAANSDAFLAGMANLSASLDREVIEHHWIKNGIFCAYIDGSHIRLVRFGEDGQVKPLDLGELYLASGFHASPSGLIGLVGVNSDTFPEAYLASPSRDGARWEVKTVTEFGRDVQNWDMGSVETIRWKSKDGVEIEGVLRKPSGFDPDKKYPLVFVVHGGPRWFSAAYLISGEDIGYYPTIQFALKDILVLKPNYRGSLGRGQAFVDLNVNNLGIGDLWDLEGAIDHLDELGWIDAEKVGCMGWSQGGYISAFAGLHSERFRAVSVGAGVSDWYTYHISNDIPDFTVDYLSGSPFQDRKMYEKTAPISRLATAKTPMLLQHGAEDRRVPLSNAMELYRGLKEMGVHVELYVYPGMGHPITKPRENHAIMHQNLAWFSHYLLGEELELE